MKRYLLTLIVLVCAVTGAWADYARSFGTGSSASYDQSTGVLTVTIATTGDFDTFVSNLDWVGSDPHINLNHTGNLRIICTNNATISSTEVNGLKTAKSNDGFTTLDLTAASFDANTTITSLMANGVIDVSLPSGMAITDVTLPAISNYPLKSVITSNGSSATLTAFGGSDYRDSQANLKLFYNPALTGISDWTITNGEAFSSVSAGEQTSGYLKAIVASSTASTLSVTLDGLTQNDAPTLAPSSSVINLTISGLNYPSDNNSTVTVSAGSNLTSLTIEDSTIPGLTISGCPELTDADLKGVKHNVSTALAVSFENDPKLKNVTLYRSSSYTTYNPSGTTPQSTENSGTVTVTYSTPAIPIEYNGCEVTINLAARSGKTMSALISEAQTTLGSTDICTLIVTGELSTTDLESLDDASAATRIDLSGATLASGASVDNIQVPTSLESLVLPNGYTVSSALETTLSGASYTSLKYVYSNTTDNGATTPTYVWIAQTGVMSHVFANESSLVSSVYVKVVAKTGVSLDANSVDLSKTDMTNLAFLDVSESGLTTAAAANYKCPSDNTYKAYRIILPNGWTGDDMAVFAANPNHGAMAAVYSYNGTTLNILEIDDNSYSTTALADARIVRSGTTEVDVLYGNYDGAQYCTFGGNLLAAINGAASSITKVVVKTGSAMPNALTFTNTHLTEIDIENTVQANAELNVDACSALTILDLKGSSIKSIDASTASLTSVDLSGAAIANDADFSGATLTTQFKTNSETIFNGALNLSSTGLTAFSTEARIVGDISFNGSNSLASIDVTAADFANTTSKIHIDLQTTEGDGNTDIISGLTTDKCIKIPSSFATSRLHPTPAANLIEQAEAVAAAVTYKASDMVFHDNNTSDAYYPTYRYWYQGDNNNNGIATLGTSNDRRLADIISGEGTLTSDSHVKIKIVGPLTSADMDALDDLNCTMLDISDATIETGLLKNKLTAGNILNSNTRFLVLPDSCTREHIINEDVLKKQTNVYSVIAVQNTSEGRDLTSWSRVSGALQPAVVGALSSSAQSWTIKPEGQTQRNVYTSDVSNFKKLEISGLINSYDLSKATQKLDANGHLSWAEDVVEAVSQTRHQNGAYSVYGPFSSCFNLTVIDLKGAHFEEWDPATYDNTKFTRYWVSDMTLSELGVISNPTYKVVIPQDSRVNEIPADFLNCSTNIRAICIPTNIRAIRTRAFYTIDYVWTTSSTGAGMSANDNTDPEGTNTRLDNGAKLSNGTAVSALTYNETTHKYEENSDFETNKYYTADYSGVNGGGTYTFGSSLRMIETGAFANTQPNVSDVYVLNTVAPECHVDAFNTVMYTGNGGYNSAKVSADGIISRDAYFNGRWITMLHYPRQTTTPQLQRYTDVTRDYSIATGLRDGKGAPIYFPNQSEFIRAYTQGTFGYVWKAWNPTREYGSVDNGDLKGHTTEGWTKAGQTAANALFDAYTSGGTDHQYTSFAGVNDSTGVTSTTATLIPYYNVHWTGAYASSGTTDQQLYPRSEIDANSDADESGEMTEKDYRGWHQFVLNAYAANTILDEEPYRSYITDDEWWTICPTFDITKGESAILFGYAKDVHGSSDSQYPYVSKLRYVRRTYGDAKGTITLNFTGNLNMKKENRTNTTDKHGQNNASGFVDILDEVPADNDVVMSAGVPYLIKPNMGASPKRNFRIFETETDYNNFRAQYSNDDWEKRDFVALYSKNLFDKIQAAQAESGATQMAHIHNGMYTVPVFVSESDGTGLVKENVEMSGSEKVAYHPVDQTTTYYKSTDWVYTFVGSFYKSFLPHYCYYLGWDSSLNGGNGGARFFYLDGEYNNPGVFTYYDNYMNWNNETGVICPTYKNNGYTTAESRVFGHTVTPAEDMTSPAQWKITDLVIDGFTSSTSGGNAKTYEMAFGAPDIIAEDSETTSIMNISEDASVNGSVYNNVNVYSVNGQFVGNSLRGLSKGVYIVNGKKFIVK